MYNKGTIIPGLIIFIAFVTFPVWFNGMTTAGDLPKPELPPGGELLSHKDVEFGLAVVFNSNGSSDTIVPLEAEIKLVKSVSS